MKPLFAAAALLAALAAASPARAACTNEPKKSLNDEVTRIKECLKAHERPHTEAEVLLYSWQHVNKTGDMTKVGQPEFCAKYTAQQQFTDELRIRRKHKTTHADVIKRALELTGAHSSLLDLQAAWDKEKTTIAEKPKKEAAEDAYMMAGYDKIYPGILLRWSQTEDQLKHDVETKLSTATGTAKARYEGDKLAFLVAGGASTISQYVSNQSVGNGVYFGANPVEFLSHFEGDSDGIVCHIKGEKIVDIDKPASRKVLSDAHILLAAPTPITNPSSYNQWAWPVAFEAAAQGHLFKWNNGKDVYVSKCAVKPAECRPIKIDDFGKCDHTEKLVAELEAKPKLAEALMKNSGGDFDHRFLAIWARCAAKGKPTCDAGLKNKLAALPKTHPLHGSLQAPEYAQVKKACGW